MRQYIYGEVYLKTNKHLYLIKVYNLCYPCTESVIYEVYVKCSGYGSIENKTLSNVYTSGDGNKHITELREDKYINYNQVNNKTWRQAILKRVKRIS